MAKSNKNSSKKTTMKDEIIPEQQTEQQPAIESGELLETKVEQAKVESVTPGNDLEIGVFARLVGSDSKPVKITERIAKHYENDPKWEVIRSKKNK